MRFKIIVVFLVFLAGVLFTLPVRADGDPPFNPVRQPVSQSPYGMDLMGPSWQWTFPREDVWPVENAELRIDLMDDMLRGSWATGVRSARIAVLWCLTEPDRDDYRWRELDTAFQLASNYGMTIVPQIFYTPDWAAIGGDTGTSCFDYQNYPRNRPPQDWSDWTDFLTELVRRYGAHGKNQAHNWEIWNEPDLLEFWYIPEDPWNANVPEYAKLVRFSEGVIDKEDIGGKVLVGSLSDIYGAKFLTRLMALEGDEDIRDAIDILTFHIFDEPHRKMAAIHKALGDNHFTMWVTEANAREWTETVPQAHVRDFFDALQQEGVSRSFWFLSWSSKWGPSIFSDYEPLWERESFEPSPFFSTFQQQALTMRVAQAPILRTPAEAVLTPPRPTFSWQRPAPGDSAIVGYKLQMDNSLYRGRPYFSSPELDAWVPAAITSFLPLQMLSGSATSAAAVSPSLAPLAVSEVHYQPASPLPAGRYYWRVAAVDAQGNVGAYSQTRTIFISAGDERVFLPVVAWP